MVNKVFLIGNLGQEVDVKYTQSGSTVANLSVATSRKWKNKDGQLQEETEWHRCTVFGKTAEFAGNYLRKGSKVYIEGRLQTRSYDKDGTKVYTTEIVVNELQNLTPRPDDTRQQDHGYPEPPPAGDTGSDVPF